MLELKNFFIASWIKFEVEEMNETKTTKKAFLRIPSGTMIHASCSINYRFYTTFSYCFSSFNVYFWKEKWVKCD